MKKNATSVDAKVASLIENTTIVRQITTIRGKQVLLDRNLAAFYGVETKVLNQAVKRNLERFPERNCFQLSKDEFDLLRSQFVTSKQEKRGGRQYIPYAFTEQGVAMLSAVLRSETAIRVSLQIMDAFVQMRHYLVANRDILDADCAILKMQVAQNTNDINTLKADYQKVMENFIDPSAYKHFLIFNGQKLEADVAYTQIYGMAKRSITIVDDYVGVKTLDLLRGVAKNISVIIYSDQKATEKLTDKIMEDFYATRLDVKLTSLPTNNKLHDRYIFLDYGLCSEKLFHCGASSKDAGGKITSIMQIECPQLYHAMMEELEKNC